MKCARKASLGHNTSTHACICRGKAEKHCPIAVALRGPKRVVRGHGLDAQLLQASRQRIHAYICEGAPFLHCTWADPIGLAPSHAVCVQAPACGVAKESIIILISINKNRKLMHVLSLESQLGPCIAYSATSMMSVPERSRHTPIQRTCKMSAISP